METQITEHYFKFGTVKYFRGKAENVVLGSYGEKADPIGASAQLNVQNRIKVEHLTGKVQIVPPVALDWAKVSVADAAFGGAIRYYVLNHQLGYSLTLAKAKAAQLKLVKLFINEGPLRGVLNNGADGARKYLADEGGDGRVVSETWVVVDGALGEQFGTAASVVLAPAATVGPLGMALDLRLEGGKYGTQTLALGAGSTFAYLMHEVTKWNKGKTQIESLGPDEKGLA